MSFQGKMYISLNYLQLSLHVNCTSSSVAFTSQHVFPYFGNIMHIHWAYDFCRSFIIHYLHHIVLFHSFDIVTMTFTQDFFFSFHHPNNCHECCIPVSIFHSVLSLVSCTTRPPHKTCSYYILNPSFYQN